MGAAPVEGRHLAGRPCGRRGTSVAVGRVDSRRLGESSAYVMVPVLAAFGADQDRRT